MGLKKGKKITYQGADGKVLGSNRNAKAFKGLILRDDAIPMRATRSRGCNPDLASKYLMTFRTSSAGYSDLDRFSGTVNLSSFRPNCSGSLIVADGVMSAPKFGHGCICNYSNQTSLALVHMPDLEMWAWGGRRKNHNRIGLNLGAPGDRVSSEDTFWTDYPSVGGKSPADLTVKITPAKPEWFRHHPSWIKSGEGLNWVACSGALGLSSINVKLGRGNYSAATVRLYFAEPDIAVGPGQRVFDVAIMGKVVLKKFDIAKAASNPLTMLVKEFKGIGAGIAVGKSLTVTLTPAAGSKPAVLCGIEVIGK